jgi:hypothetical protein
MNYHENDKDVIKCDEIAYDLWLKLSIFEQ